MLVCHLCLHYFSATGWMFFSFRPCSFKSWLPEFHLCASPQRGNELPHLLLHLRGPGWQEETGPLQAVRQQNAKVGLTRLSPHLKRSSKLPKSPILIFVSPFQTCRYLCNEHVKLGPDIVSNTFYKEQFDAVEQCFKVIGFTLEVIKKGLG